MWATILKAAKNIGAIVPIVLEVYKKIDNFIKDRKKKKKELEKK